MSLLNPSSIAIIGASATEGKVGHDILKNLVTQGYGGKVFPVNPKGGEILGKQAFATVSDIPETPDVAIIVIPATSVPDALKECGEKGVKNVIVISAGFGEVHTDEGTKLEEELIAIAKKYAINLVGPNCLGIVRPSTRMNASFAKDLPPAGNIAVISQSGAMGVALMDAASSEGLKLSAFISIGNKAVMDEAGMLELLAEDPETTVIGFYLESIKDGKRFLASAKKVSATKSLVLLKAGVSALGRIAASSHTGALAGSDATIEALCSETGMRRARSTEEFLDLLSVLSMEPPLLSSNIAVITNAGGPGILATDAAEVEQLSMPLLSSKTIAALESHLPTTANTRNPVDVIGDAGAERYTAAIEACREDESIDGLVILLTPQVMTPVSDIAQTIVAITKNAPLMPVVCAFMGGESVQEGKEILRASGIPVFPTPERAMRAMAALKLVSLHRRCVDLCTSDDLEIEESAVKERPMSSLLSGMSGLLDEDATTKLFSQYHLPLPAQALATTAEEAVSIAARIGYPVIAKISSPDILHKTDVGGVRANLTSPTDVIKSFNDIIENVSRPAASGQRPAINGILIQQFLPVGSEFIVGAVRDATFRPLIMVGLGGIYTELFRDTSFRIAPVCTEEAYRMLSDLKSWKLLLGMRGKPQADIDALVQLIVNVSKMMLENPTIKELDLNPVLVRSDGVMIADAKVVVEKEG